MASTENRGKTAREAVLEYCTSWTQVAYLHCWPTFHEPNPNATAEEKKAACLAVERELMAMLRLAFKPGEEEEPSAPNPTESQEVKPIRRRRPIRRGRLPKKKGETSQVPIIAGLLDGKVSRLRVDAQGAWTLEPREDAFAGKPMGGKQRA